jgi:MoaA/NifB/PqqE/SkfB family radical SAM enzyme
MGNVRLQTLEEVWNGEKYKTMRKKMLAGEKCSECTACYKSEDAGVVSMRQSNMNRFKQHIPLADNTNTDGSVKMTLKYFDVRWSNICNFKCRSCSSTYSSSWATEDNARGYEKRVFIFAGGNNNDELYDQFLPHFADIEEFYFAGGEPLLTDKHYDILEYLISIGKTDVRIQYNTNLSNLKYKEKSVLELWKHFPNIQVYASLDSWGERAEYIREGTDWSVIESNLKLITKQLPHVQLQMSSVISALNVITLPEFLDYIIESKLFNVDTFKPSLYNLINPHFYSFSIINDNLKSNIIEKLSTVTYSPAIDDQIKNVILSLKSSKYNKDLYLEFIKVTREFDLLRNRNFENTFPELNDM